MWSHNEENEGVTPAAIQGLNGLEIGERKLIVKKHEAAKQMAGGMKDIAGNKAVIFFFNNTIRSYYMDTHYKYYFFLNRSWDSSPGKGFI